MIVKYFQISSKSIISVFFCIILLKNIHFKFSLLSFFFFNVKKLSKNFVVNFQNDFFISVYFKNLLNSINFLVWLT